MEDIMAVTNSTNRSYRGSPWTGGPLVTFAAAVAVAFAVATASAALLHSDFALPVISTLFFVLSALVALVAWSRPCPSDQSRVTYWDVAGALTLIGICAAAQVEPDQMVRLVEGAHRQD
jgi:hypothetical protein